MNKSEKNVIIFGESGSGKSSLVNLLLGQNRAEISDKAVGCTFTFQRYETPNFTLYDTVGLSEGASGTVRPDLAIKQLITLLQSLKDGVSLLIFVIEKGRIKKSLNKNYNLFVDGLCMKNVPVVLTITHCEMEAVQGTWWKENQMFFEKYGMSFKAVVSGSALQPTCAPPMVQPILRDLNNKIVTDLLTAIDSSMLATPWKVEGGWSNWFYTIFKKVANLIGNFVCSKTGTESYEKRLNDYFQSQGYDTNQSDEMAEHISKEIAFKEDRN